MADVQCEATTKPSNEDNNEPALNDEFDSAQNKDNTSTYDPLPTSAPSPVAAITEVDIQASLDKIRNDLKREINAKLASNNTNVVPTNVVPTKEATATVGVASRTTMSTVNSENMKTERQIPCNSIPQGGIQLMSIKKLAE